MKLEGLGDELLGLVGPSFPGSLHEFQGLSLGELQLDQRLNCLVELREVLKLSLSSSSSQLSLRLRCLVVLR